MKAPSISGLWPTVSERVRHASRRLLDTVERGFRRSSDDTNAQARTQRDQKLARKLSRAFERDLEMASLHGVQFYVRGGVVTLYGTVAHTLDRRLVVDLVRSVPGVDGVVAHLQVIGDSNTAPRPD